MPQIPLEKTRSRGPQARGEIRRRKLLDAAMQLLDERDMSDISLNDVAAVAGIPVGSIYYHYKTINELFGKVLVTYREQLAEDVTRSYDLAADAEWPDLVGKIIDRIHTLAVNHYAYVQVALNRHAPVQIRYESGQKGGWEFVPIVKGILDRYYQLPELPNIDTAILNFTDIADAMFVRSVEDRGHIDDATLQEAKRASIAYLRLYLPDYLPRRLVKLVATSTNNGDET